MQCFVINLKDDPYRLAHITETFGRNDIPFVRIDAIDAERIASHPAAKRLPELKSRPWMPSEVGCLLSHFEAWKAIADGCEECAAVFEDDVIIDRRLKALLSDRSLLPETFDVVKLDTVKVPVYLERTAVTNRIGLEFRLLRSRQMGASAYLITRSTAAYLVDSLGSFDQQVDVALFSPDDAPSSRLLLYQVLPGLAIQDSDRSKASQNPALASRMAQARIDAWRAYESRLPIRRRIMRRALRPLQLGFRYRIRQFLRWGFRAQRLIVPFGAD